MISSYCKLAKPGIILGNAITAMAGFALASKGHFDYGQFFITLLGLSLIIGSACSFNNTIDCDKDKLMQRTKNRPLPKGLISPKNAVLFAGVLGVLGVFFLSLINFLAVSAAVIGFTVYVLAYSFLKYRSIHATLVGSVAGAMPPVVGYLAASGHFDLGAGLLFGMVTLWQMPHFFAIALYRLEDYTAALIPVLPVKKGIFATKIHMLFYVSAFAIAALTPTLFGYTGYAYLTVAALLGLFWLWLSIKGFKSSNDKLWARQMFRFSLVTITALSAMLALY